MPRYHWILTLQHPKPHGGMGIANGSGTITPATGQTRESLFRQIFQHVCDRSGVAPARASVLFFDLQPNELT